MHYARAPRPDLGHATPEKAEGPIGSDPSFPLRGLVHNCLGYRPFNVDQNFE